MNDANKFHKFDKEWILERISPYGNKAYLRSAAPTDGVAKYVWRMIRFHSGKDMHSPVNCYFNLSDQLIADGVFKKPILGIIDDEHKEILDILDKLVIECTDHLGLSHITAASRWKGILY